MSRILLVNPPSRRNVYLATNVRVGAPSYPSLTLATIAGRLADSHDLRLLDLDLYGDLGSPIAAELARFRPEIVASTANTPDYPSVVRIMGHVKALDPRIATIVGGVHVTALPGEAMREPAFDAVVVGEADDVVPGLFASPPRRGDLAVRVDGSRVLDLDALPYPAWRLFALDRYRNSRLSSRKNPVGLIETSRGCAYHCCFCSKLTFGSAFRAKDPERVVDEMVFLLKSGFREIHITDDSFTQDIDRAKRICEGILRRGLSFPWSLINGIRVDFVDREFFRLAKRAGCWQVGYGIESGDQRILDIVGKKTTLGQIENAVALAREAGVATFGFFIFGLPGEDAESMERTISFAKRLPLDIAKFDICIPYPGTPYYEELRSSGSILTDDWALYNCHQVEKPLFRHPNLSWEELVVYYKRAFREFYFRPRYIARRFARSLCRGDLLSDARALLMGRW